MVVFVVVFVVVLELNYDQYVQFQDRQIHNIKMLRVDQLQKTLTALVRGKSDLILYGNKSSGKTYLSRKILDSVIGKDNYLSIKCIFVSDRSSLLYLTAHQLYRVLNKLDSNFRMDKQDRWQMGQFSTMGEWIKTINRFVKQKEEICVKVPRLYIFMDNMEEFRISQTFLKQFYFGLKHQIKHLKFSFFFCGVALISPILSVYQPFRMLPQFVMPRPHIQDIVTSVVSNSDLVKKALNDETGNFKKLVKHVQRTLISAFQSIQYEIERTWLLCKSFLIEVNEYCGTNPENAELWMKKNQDNERDFLNKLKEFGAVTLQRTNNETLKKSLGHQQVQQGEATFYTENYPNLLITSLGLANGFPESEDIKRFVDMKRIKSARQKAKYKKNQQNADHTFKIDHKKVRHTKQRIIAIAQTLEQQSHSSTRLREKDFKHHTLDYYGCFQYLREEGYINFYGKNSKFGGTITGNPKESEVKDFMQKLNLDYFQYTGKN